MDEEIPGAGGRRPEVLDAALRVFARFGYRKTSMDDVAKEAQISRPGLYFLFASKSALFREAAEWGVELDLAAAELALAVPARPLDERIIDAFDCWAGRYVGPLEDISTLIENNADLLGPVSLNGPQMFEALLLKAFDQTALVPRAPILTRMLISLSIGVKRQARDREEYRTRMAEAVRLLVPTD